MRRIILVFMVAVYPLIVIPGFLDTFRGPRYIVLLVASLLALYLLYKDRISLNHSVFIPLGFFLFFALLSNVLADNPTMAWLGSYIRYTGVSTYLFCVLLFLLAFQYKKPEHILVPMILGAVVASIIGVMQYYGINIIPHPSYSPHSIQAYSTMGHVNWFGCYAGFILTASLLFYLHENKLIWLITSAIIYAGLLVSLTRGAWLAFLVSFIIICSVLYKNREIKKQFAILVLVFAAVTLILITNNAWQLFDRASTVPRAVTFTVSLFDDSVRSEDTVRDDESLKDESLKSDDSVRGDDSVEGTASVFERIYIWKETTEIIKNNWVFGIGADHLLIIMPDGRIEDKAHNIYLEIFVCMGIFTLISYLVFLSFFLRRQNNKIGFILLIMILTYLFQGFINNEVIQFMPLFWIVLGLSLSNSVYGDKLKDEDKSTSEDVAENGTSNRKSKSVFLDHILLAIIVVSMLITILWYFYPSLINAG